MSEEVYFKPNAEEVSQIRKLLDFLMKEVLDTGGDGDAIWYSKNYNIDDIKLILEEHYCDFWKVERITRPNSGDSYLSWGIGQEGIIISNSKAIFDSRPELQQISIEF